MPGMRPVIDYPIQSGISQNCTHVNNTQQAQQVLLMYLYIYVTIMKKRAMILIGSEEGATEERRKERGWKK